MSNELATLPTNTALALPTDFLRLLNENIEIGLSSLSDKNRIEYEATFKMWASFASDNGLGQYDFELMAVKTFLTDNNWSFNTRKVRLAHLRKFAELLALADPDNKVGYAANFGRLALLKPKSLGGIKAVAVRKELSTIQVGKIFETWLGDNNKNTRNRAILGLMFFAALRASETAHIKWEHIDYDKKRLFVYEGKGKKSAYVPMLGDLPKLLKAWQVKQALAGDYEYISVGINKGDNLLIDSPVAIKAITKIVKDTTKRTKSDTYPDGIAFKPHDTRRTVITDLIDRGATVAEVRDFARHSNEETTLGYAKKQDATALGVKLSGKLSYEAVLPDEPTQTDLSHLPLYSCENCSHMFHGLNSSYCPQCKSHNIMLQMDISEAPKQNTKATLRQQLKQNLILYIVDNCKGVMPKNPIIRNEIVEGRAEINDELNNYYLAMTDKQYDKLVNEVIRELAKR